MYFLYLIRILFLAQLRASTNYRLGKCNVLYVWMCYENDFRFYRKISIFFFWASCFGKFLWLSREFISLQFFFRTEETIVSKSQNSMSFILIKNLIMSRYADGIPNN